MTAIACLKVFVGDELRFADNDTMAALVGKVAGAYLETTWLWPRRYGLVAPFSFVLADPRATKLDARELQALARDLQFKLFGDKGEGDIALLMFEGDQTDVMRFAGIHGAQLKALLEGKDDGSIVGRVCRITPTEVSSVVPQGGPVCGAPTMEELAVLEPPEESAGPPARVGYRGVYHGPRQVFIGSVAVWRQARVAAAFGLTPARVEADRPEDDIVALAAAAEALAAVPVGVMFFPISFSTIVKPGARAALLPHLEALPRGSRARLAAAVYDTPRAPSFSALSQVKKALEPFFARLDLRVTDPAFQIEELPGDLASSVTLVLPTADEPTRLAAVNRFLRDAPIYRRKGVWQGITDVRTRRELNHCLDQHAPFVTGPAVTDLLEKPVGAAQLPWLNLPLHDWSVAPEVAAVSSVA
ncbi:hypothetical protein ASD21_00025 [Caulobacter sp. Root1455]|nr:hypothetical protein ASD38_05280 [Caulobacter sp. Root487D2Y]KQZ06074.1 hypothetical protein ASD21_00025 [Caulobacter sp. Root1455]